jgi:hypothetical protein
MNKFFIERRYINLLGKAIKMGYLFKTNKARETLLKDSVSEFTIRCHGWYRVKSFIPFTHEYNYRNTIAGYLKELEGYVNAAPFTNPLKNRYKGKLKVSRMYFKQAVEKIKKLEAEKTEAQNATKIVKIVPSSVVSSKNGEIKAPKFRTHFFRNKSNSFSPNFVTYNIDSLNRRINNQI